jgi:hypothetical protein
MAKKRLIRRDTATGEDWPRASPGNTAWHTVALDFTPAEAAMVRHIRPFLLFVCLVCSLAACQQEPASSSPAANSTTSAHSSKPAAGSAGFINVTPGAMTSCDPAAEATVKWDLHGTHPDANTVDVYVDDGSNVQLFTEGGASGEAKTGPWTRPGTTFILKNKTGNQKLDEVRVGGPTCQVKS